MSTAAFARAEKLDARRAEIVARMVRRQFDEHPELGRRYGPDGRKRCTEDAEFHVSYLAEAIRAGSARLFTEYIAWVRDMLEHRHVPAADLETNLEVLAHVVRDVLDGQDAEAVTAYIDAAREAVRTPVPAEASPAEPGSLSTLARDYVRHLVDGNRAAAESLAMDALARGVPVRDLYLDVFQEAQREIGRLWQQNRITVAQEHQCTAATERIMARVLASHSPTADVRPVVVVANVALEQHAMGARILADFLEMDGWDVHYLGANTPTLSIVEIVRERRAAVLAVSATMAFHIPHVRDLIIRVRARPDLSGLKVIVGGRPFNIEPELWRRVGADGYAADAPAGVAQARNLLDGTRR